MTKDLSYLPERVGMVCCCVHHSVHNANQLGNNLWMNTLQSYPLQCLSQTLFKLETRCVLYHVSKGFKVLWSLSLPQGIATQSNLWCAVLSTLLREIWRVGNSCRWSGRRWWCGGWAHFIHCLLYSVIELGSQIVSLFLIWSPWWCQGDLQCNLHLVRQSMFCFIDNARNPFVVVWSAIAYHYTDAHRKKSCTCRCLLITHLSELLLHHPTGNWWYQN